MKDQSLLLEVLSPGSLTVTYQPVLSVDTYGLRFHYLECLVRGPSGTNLERADVLFEYVRRKRAEALMDRRCMETILEQSKDLPVSAHLSINVHASTLDRDQRFVSDLRAVARRHGFDLNRLTIEVVEHSPVFDGPAFDRTVAELREDGVRIALDDVGLGYCNYGMVLNCKPDYFKMDRYFVNGCHGDPHRRHVLESVALLAQRFESWVIGEGIETIEDMNVLLGLGIDLFQGYLFSPPLQKTELLSSDLFGELLEGILIHTPVAEDAEERRGKSARPTAGVIA
jgi:EAL domain-containing protein (putative c-di-GMP-specific phosphodiesterase class I)